MNPANRGVDVTVAGVDVQVKPKIAGPVRAQVSGTVAKVKGSVSLKKGVEVDVAPFETGVGLQAGPVGAKLLFGISAGFKLEGGKFKAKLVYGIGGELELDISSMMKPVQLPQVPKPLPVPNILPTATQGQRSHSSSVMYETVPPPSPHETVPPPPVPRPRSRHRITVPDSSVHGCQFGPGDPGRTGMPRVWGLR